MKYRGDFYKMKILKIFLIEIAVEFLVLGFCYLAIVQIGFLLERDLSGLASFVVFSVVVCQLTINWFKNK